MNTDTYKKRLISNYKLNKSIKICGSLIIRVAKTEDIDAIYEIGINEEGFLLSKNTKFYGKNFLKNWIKNPYNDILIVAQFKDKIVGFLFCRIIRNSWAILENIAVIPQKRMMKVGSLLLEVCLNLLLDNGIDYISGIIREGNKNEKFFGKKGFSFGNKFVWIEKYIGDSNKNDGGT